MRIPLWVDRKAIRCTRGGQELPQVWFGGYLRFQDLKPDDALTIEFPMVETNEEWGPRLHQQQVKQERAGSIRVGSEATR